MHSDLELKARVTEFLEHEAQLIDDRRFDEWLALYADDIEYWVPVDPAHVTPLDGPSIFFDDHQVMRARIARLNHEKAHAETPVSRTCHVVGGVRVEHVDGGILDVRSNLLMADYRRDVQRLFVAHVRHRLIVADDAWLISRKRVDLVNSQGSIGTINIPF